MKKILFAAFAALSMIACNKDDATTVIPDIDNTLNGAIVAMRFTDETPTRAFFAEAAAAEAWEKSLSSLSVYVFNAKGPYHPARLHRIGTHGPHRDLRPAARHSRNDLRLLCRSQHVPDGRHHEIRAAGKAGNIRRRL